MFIGKAYNIILAKEASEEREPGNSKHSNQPGNSRNGHFGGQSAHQAHVLHLSMHCVVQGMQHAARAQEKQGFEEGMCEEVEHTGSWAIHGTRYAQAAEHVS